MTHIHKGHGWWERLLCAYGMLWNEAIRHAPRRPSDTPAVREM